MRHKIAHTCFALSSVFKALGKVIIAKEKTIVVDALTLPGWFVLDNHIIHQVVLKSKKLIGFEWHTYLMPEAWITEMDKLKRRN